LLNLKIKFYLFAEGRDCGQNQASYIEQEVLIPVFVQRGELPLLPFGNPIGFVPASRGGVYIE